MSEAWVPCLLVSAEEGSYLRLIDCCITQHKAQGPSRTYNESKDEEEVSAERGRCKATRKSKFRIDMICPKRGCHVCLYLPREVDVRLPGKRNSKLAKISLSLCHRLLFSSTLGSRAFQDLIDNIKGEEDGSYQSRPPYRGTSPIRQRPPP